MPCLGRLLTACGRTAFYRAMIRPGTNTHRPRQCWLMNTLARTRCFLERDCLEYKFRHDSVVLAFDCGFSWIDFEQHSEAFIRMKTQDGLRKNDTRHNVPRYRARTNSPEIARPAQMRLDETYHRNAKRSLPPRHCQKHIRCAKAEYLERKLRLKSPGRQHHYGPCQPCDDVTLGPKLLPKESVISVELS